MTLASDETSAPAESPAARLVLLVEDEALVALVAAETLRMMGFEPIVAADAGEALGVIDGGAALSLAIIDVGLPDMRGDALAHRIRGSAPRLPIILASGYDRAELARGFAADPRTRVLSKPYSEGELGQALTELGLANA